MKASDQSYRAKLIRYVEKRRKFVPDKGYFIVDPHDGEIIEGPFEKKVIDDILFDEAHQAIASEDYLRSE